MLYEGWYDCLYFWGVGGNLWARLVCTWKFLIFQVVFTLVEVYVLNSVRYACISGSIQCGGPWACFDALSKSSSRSCHELIARMKIKMNLEDKVIIRWPADAGLPKVWAYFIDLMVTDLTTIFMYISFLDSCLWIVRSVLTHRIDIDQRLYMR